MAAKMRDLAIPVGIPVSVTVEEFAAIIGITDRQVRQFITDKVIKKDGKQLDFIESLQAYTTRLRESAAGRGHTTDGKSLATSRAHLADLQAQEVQMRIDRAKGLWLPFEDVTAGWTSIAGVVKSNVIGATSQIGHALPHLTAHDRVKIGEIHREVLKNIAEEASSAEVPGSVKGKEFLRDVMPLKPVPIEVPLKSNRGRPRGS